MRRLFCDVTGRELTLPHRCERIASLSPAITEALFLMGLGEYVVGVSGYCVRPQQARTRPIIGSYNKVKADLLRELSPEVIFTTTGYQRPTALELSDRFNVWAVPLPATLSALIATCSEAGLVTGYPQRAHQLQGHLFAMLNSLWHLRLPFHRRTKVYIEIDLGGAVSFGAYSYITDACALLGIANVFEERACEWLTPTPEELAEADPDIIIYEPKMFGRRHRTLPEVKRLFEERGLGKLRAVVEGRIAITPSPYDFLAHHGPSFITEAMPWLATQVRMLSVQLPSRRR